VREALPKKRWGDEVINDFKKLKLENLISSLKIEKPGMIWCIRPKPM
jgi:hypothetical protein